MTTDKTEDARGASRLHAELGADFDREEERYLREALAMLDESYRKMAKPYIERLAFIQSLRPPPPMFVTKEQAEALGLKVPNVQIEPTPLAAVGSNVGLGRED